MSAVTPIDPTNIMWITTHSSVRMNPQCATASMSGLQVVTQSGDWVYATNRCMCLPSTSGETCFYFSLSTTLNTVDYITCGTDNTCKSNCQASEFSIASVNPCASNGFTGTYSKNDFTTSDTWESGFNTPYFYYWSYSYNDPTCKNPASGTRIPMYPTCTQVLNGVYSITINNTLGGTIDAYECTDSTCSTCQLAWAHTLFGNVCQYDSGSSGTNYSTYEGGGMPSTPSLTFRTALPSKGAPTPAVTGASSTPSPSDVQPAQSGSNMPLIVGMVGGFIVLLLAVGGGLVFWYRVKMATIKNQAPPAPPPPDVTPVGPPTHYQISTASSAVPVAALTVPTMPVFPAAAQGGSRDSTLTAVPPPYSTLSYNTETASSDSHWYGDDRSRAERDVFENSSGTTVVQNKQGTPHFSEIIGS
ncbi:uncharacterized protein BJ171DRAFT_526677 [Polychytrium aggregatum]|uniref:uncharacterized protein n=1 Tax=Polychytrium aggregatum TaxID=110093 RepID=UPI0022FE64A2|nr:uncharacterized protein BJ171DRAFT_526677 [Polychytrium aggregatum]KAI9193458.1 hypothetical protein BJ171DRAFT_526677 [Polychytrium aggregatum]